MGLMVFMVVNRTNGEWSMVNERQPAVAAIRTVSACGCVFVQLVRVRSVAPNSLPDHDHSLLPDYRASSRTTCPISGTMSFVIASRTAGSDPGRENTAQQPMVPAQARLSMAADPI
jgi:hypothetical protein